MEERHYCEENEKETFVKKIPQTPPCCNGHWGEISGLHHKRIQR